MLLPNYEKQTCSHLTIVISITVDFHVELLKPKSQTWTFDDNYRALLFVGFSALDIIFFYK